jgi:hypothetical protein
MNAPLVLAVGVGLFHLLLPPRLLVSSQRGPAKG